MKRLGLQFLPLLAAGLVACSLGMPASAQSARIVAQAFAAVQAPESAVEVCHATSAQGALDCARKRCQRKAGRGTCFAVTVCEPSGWAGTMGVQMSEVHFTTTICGAPSRDAAIAVLRAFCEGHAGSKQCTINRLWTPDGKAVPHEQSWTPADFKK